MNEVDLYQKLVKICGKKSVSKDPELLETYSSDLSFVKGKVPKYIVWPSKTKLVEELLKLANLDGLTLIPVSSRSSIRYHGDVLPQKNNSIIVNLSKMSKIIDINRKNRVVMIEPGVVFRQLIPILQKQGLRLLHPLLPRDNKSVLTSALEREPIIIPRYQWDSSDPLLCTEVVFGTGDLFRTGTAAGPGSIKQQKKSGQSQLNPMGPTQFSPFRILQGAQGSLGIVTWSTLKLELMPSIQRVYHLQSDNLEKLLEFQQKLLKYRLCDELFILNNLNLACLVKKQVEDINKLSKSLKEWNLIYVISGRGALAKDRIEYLKGDIGDIKRELKLDEIDETSPIDDNEFFNIINNSTTQPWRMRFKGGFQDIFFISNFEKLYEFISLAKKLIPNNLGIYIQAMNQGTSYHCEFDMFYNPKDVNITSNIKDMFIKATNELMSNGAFFNRPYGLWGKEVYKYHEKSTQVALKKVKKIFDPKNVLNPGVLCFDD